MKRVRSLKFLIPLLVVGLLTVFALVGTLGGREGLTENDGSPGDEPQSRAVAPEGETAAGGQAAKGSGAPDDLAAVAPPAGSSSNRFLIRTGDLSLLIDRGALLATVDRAAGMTAELDGYVVSSSLSSSGSVTGVTSRVEEPLVMEKTVDSSPDDAGSETLAPTQAWLTLRVPESRFEAAMTRFTELGDVQRVGTSSEDVTSQYVDLKARLRHHRAVERRLLRFLAASTTIREMLVVQDRLDEVQLTIEQLEAQLKSLREVTTYSTVTLQLTERGTQQAGQIDPSDSFGAVFWQSLTTLGRGARLVALALTAALPFLVVFGALGAGSWYLARWLRRRHAEQPSLPL